MMNNNQSEGSMPYIITTSVNVHGDELCVSRDVTSRRAVATLEEARAEILAELGDRNTITGPEDDLCANVLDLSEASGGTVGPLPDGTVIEVQRVAWQWLVGVLEDRGADLSAIEADNEMIGLYNAQAS